MPARPRVSDPPREPTQVGVARVVFGGSGRTAGGAQGSPRSGQSSLDVDPLSDESSVPGPHAATENGPRCHTGKPSPLPGHLLDARRSTPLRPRAQKGSPVTSTDTTSTPPQGASLSAMRLADLKTLAQQRGRRGLAGKRKGEIVAMLEDARGGRKTSSAAPATESAGSVRKDPARQQKNAGGDGAASVDPAGRGAPEEGSGDGAGTDREQGGEERRDAQERGQQQDRGGRHQGRDQREQQQGRDQQGGRGRGQQG